MSETFNNMTNSHRLSVSDALGVLVSAAEARRDQYQDLADRRGVDAATEELWDVGVQEAVNMAELIGSALDVFREHRDQVLDAKPPALEPPRVASSALRVAIRRILDVLRSFAEDLDKHRIGSQGEAAHQVRKIIHDIERHLFEGRHYDMADAFALAAPVMVKKRELNEALNLQRTAMANRVAGVKSEYDCPEGGTHEYRADYPDRRCIHCGAEER